MVFFIAHFRGGGSCATPLTEVCMAQIDTDTEQQTVAPPIEPVTATPEVERVAVWPENEEGIERYIPQKERDAIPASAFCGPHRSFPVRNQKDVDNAASLAGHADNPDAVRACIRGKAKANGWKLPDSWETGKKDDGSRTVESTDNHESMTDTPDTSKDDTTRAVMPECPMLYVPITRIDDQKWEVEGIATSEAVDSFNTIFSYEASKKAFQKWIERTANVREMHDRKAVGKGVGVQFDDEQKQVIVRLRVSKGAPDTWTKIQEGVLSGLSVGAGKPYTWESIERNGQTYPYLTSYELAELSVVDNASNPDGHGLSICRADGLTDLIDVTEPETPPPVEPAVIATPKEPEVERAGARLSSDTQSALHGARDSALQSAMQLMKTCGCPDCIAMRNAMDPDNDNDVDLPGADKTLDPDQDAGKMADRIAEVLLTRITQELHTPITRMHAIAGTFARSHTPEIDFSPIQTSLETIVTRLETVPTQSSLDEVRSALAEVKGQVEVIARQPASGGPILNGARPVDKTLATDPRPSQLSQPQQETTLDVLNRLQRMGALDTIEKQVAAAALAAQPTRGRTQ